MADTVARPRPARPYRVTYRAGHWGRATRSFATIEAATAFVRELDEAPNRRALGVSHFAIWPSR